MRHTSTAVFDDRRNAEHALNKLLAAGYSRAEVTLSSVAQAGQINRESSESTEEEGGFYESTRIFFAQLLGTQSNDFAVSYSDVSTRKRHVLILTTESEPEAERAAGLVDGLVSAQSDDTPDRHIQGVADPIRAGYPSGTEPGALQNRAHGKNHYFGTRNSDDASPLGTTFRDTLFSATRWPRDNDGPANVGLADLLESDNTRGNDEGAASRFGKEMHISEMSRNRSWNDAEDHLKSSWERRHPGIWNWDRLRQWTAAAAEVKTAWALRHVGELPPWERFKDALLHGWGRISLDNDAIAAAHPTDDTDSATAAGRKDDVSPAFRFGDKMHHTDRFWGCEWEDVESELRDVWNSQFGGLNFADWGRNWVEVRQGWDHSDFSNRRPARDE
jgi:hypothetical protein